MTKSTIKQFFWMVSMLVLFGFMACNNPETAATKTAAPETPAMSEPAPGDTSMQLIHAMEKVNGGWGALSALKDVQFDYKYDDKAKGIDQSVEKYIFADETSWGSYSEHNANVLPGTEGQVTQLYMDGKASISHDGKPVTDPKAIGGTVFLRQANYYWFTMMYKLADPGAVHEYLGKEMIGEINYDKVKITFKGTGKDADDTYICYFNPINHLVDQFYFSLPAMGINEPIIKMELEYKKMNGVYVNTLRKAYFPDGKGGYNLGGEYTTSNIKFDNGFTKSDLAI